jgi:hypothetical protein
MPARLYRRHDPASQAKYQDAKRLARSQARVLAGTPGMLKQRTQSGNRYWVREYIRADGKKTDDYIGAVSAVKTATIDKLRGEIELGGALAAASAALRLFGYQRIDRKPAAVLQAFYNRGLFKGGLALVGSHAYGALLNELGIAAGGYATQEIQVARAQPLAVALPEDFSFEALLKESGLNFVPVPGMPSDRPSASFKLPGAELLGVDLLVPGERTGAILPVKELHAYGQAIPLLDYLIDDDIPGVVLSPNQIIPVRVPAPERFAIHKLFSSQSRRADRGKASKDLVQAAVLVAAIEDETPGRIMDALRGLPRPARPALKRGAAAAAKLVHGAHASAHGLLLKIAAR